ncbi:hypothetical protein [Actinophytocola sp.]|uniref:hypothetical protein n=1 Tax=Actinophytocola sp. TaxID=1872138 RepID=UPI002ED64988
MFGALLALLAGCGTIHLGGSGGKDQPEQSTESVDHEILYDVQVFSPGFTLQVSYTDENGGGGSEQPLGQTWTKTFTARYPDIPELYLTAFAVPNPSSDPTAVLSQPSVLCILWVDGNIADQSQSASAECHAKLTDTVVPPTSSSR